MSKNRLFVTSAALFFLFLLFTSPPFSFPSGSTITIPEGVGLFTLSEQLEQDNVIRSPFWFRLAAIVLGGERLMRAGEYYMSRPENAFIIAWRVLHGKHNVATIKLTIPEGFTVEEISNLFDGRFAFFNHQFFESQAPEGYLFPDTYFIQVTATASSTLKLFRDNFDRKIGQILPDVKRSGKTLEDVIIMASIIESEVKSEEDKRIVSGILWKRLKIDMPLQVDSDPDTYEHTGFPPKPISNPGLESIEAAINPTTTPYLYFLTGKDGITHYARTFEEHKDNKLKFLSR